MSIYYFRLVVAVAKDLQSDFYPKFPKFFIKLVDLLQVREPEITEWADRCTPGWTLTGMILMFKSDQDRLAFILRWD